MSQGAEALNRLTERVIGAAIRVHQALGPGLMETAYGREIGRRKARGVAEPAEGDIIYSGHGRKMQLG